jgi:hypothetical protein
MRLHDRVGEVVEIPKDAIEYVHETGSAAKGWQATIVWRPPRARFPASIKVREPKSLIDLMLEGRVSDRGA